MAVMRSVNAIIAATIAISIVHNEPAHALGAGATTCGQYLRAGQRSRAPINQWILGYATGANEVGHLVFRRDFMSGIGQKALFESIVDYCRRNRNITLQNAAQDFLEFVRQSALQQ
jgi:hypothetical protein